MALATKFVRQLNKVMKRRTDAIRRIVVPSRGAPAKMNKEIRDRYRVSLLDLASQILVRGKARKEFERLVHPRRLRSISGRGIQNRFDGLYSWAQENLRGPIVYSFWKRSSCLYVGKGKSYRRLRGYQGAHRLMVADSLKVWQVKSRSKLPSAECLAVHLFKPSENKNKPAKVKWGKKCPVCRRHDELKGELDSLLRLKG